jgi:magnesium and cobalt transporter
LDGESHSGLWSRITSIFSGKGEHRLAQAISEAREEGELKDEEGSMLLSILTLDEIQAQDIMTPRTDIDCLPSGLSVREAAKAIGETGHSRMPIYKDTRDVIIGIAYAKDLLGPLGSPENHGTPVDAIMREPFFVPETKIASELLQEFRSRKNHLAVVVDEYGGTSGLVTIEDLLEVIVGDIEDEHDMPREDDIRSIGPDEYEIAGRAFLEDLDTLGIKLRSDEVDTISGYLCLLAGRVPHKGETFSFNGWSFTVAGADAKHIHKIIARPGEA